MKKIKRFVLLLSSVSGGRWGIVVISMVLPAIVMMGFGFFLAYKYEYMLAMSVAIGVSTLLFSVPLYLLSQKTQANTPHIKQAGEQTSEDGLVKASAEWSQYEMDIWEKAKIHARTALAAQNNWSDLDAIGLSIMELVATAFDKQALDFSLPEGLVLCEEISRRYKIVLKDYIPIVELIKISHIKAGYDAYDKYGVLGGKAIKAAIWANHAKNAYLNPTKLAIDLLTQQSSSGMTKGVFDDMQDNAKQALLDEIASVAIDLYSGRFCFEGNELTHSKVSKKDALKVAAVLEPTRVVMVGQTCVGKSSLINALQTTLSAEVDVLPATDDTTVYNTVLDDVAVRLVDMPGLDGSHHTLQQMLNAMVNADLIIWVVKANQPARALDEQLGTLFHAHYAESANLSYKKPNIICVVNQVDKLNPAQEWSPPYSLTPPNSLKEKMISEAVAYQHSLLKPNIALPLCIAPGKAYFGLSKVKQAVLTSISEANNVQRNRQRMEAINKGINVKNQLGRVVKAGKKVAPNALKAVSPSLLSALIKKLLK